MTRLMARRWAWRTVLVGGLILLSLSLVGPVLAAGVGAAGKVEPDYLTKLFNSLAGKTNLAEPLPTLLTGATGWLLGIVATVLYGEVALAAILWILFRSDLVGIGTASLLIALALAFTLPRRPRPIGLLVLAALNLVLAFGLTVTIAFSEGLYPVLLSIVPAAGLLWLAVRSLIKPRKRL